MVDHDFADIIAAEYRDDDEMCQKLDRADGYHSNAKALEMLQALAGLEPFLRKVDKIFAAGNSPAHIYRNIIADCAAWAENPCSETMSKMHSHAAYLGAAEAHIRHLRYRADVGDHAKYQVVARLERYIWLDFDIAADGQKGARC